MLPGRQIETRTAAAPSCLLPACVALLVTLVAAQSPDEALLEAERHRRDGDSGAALSVLDSAASEFPDQPLIHFNRGALLAEHGRYEEAEAALMAGLALEPGNPEARLTLAKVLVQSHRHEEALAHVDQYAAAVGEPSQGFDVHYVRGLALRRLDRLAESERELRSATAVNPGHADALFNLGAVLDQQGSHGEAEDYLRKAAGLQPGNADFRYRLASVLKKNGKVRGGRSAARSVSGPAGTHPEGEASVRPDAASGGEPAGRRSRCGQGAVSAGHSPGSAARRGTSESRGRIRAARPGRVGGGNVPQGARDPAGLLGRPPESWAQAGGEGPVRSRRWRVSGRRCAWRLPISQPARRSRWC